MPQTPSDKSTLAQITDQAFRAKDPHREREMLTQHLRERTRDGVRMNVNSLGEAILGEDEAEARLQEYLRVRVHQDDTAFDLFARVCAAHAAGCRVTVSFPPDFVSPALKLLDDITDPRAGAIELIEEGDAQLAQVMNDQQPDRVRYAAPERAPLEVLQASAESGICVVSTPVVAEGRLELLWYVQEQSISIDYHRYGNLGERSSESRSEPL